LTEKERFGEGSGLGSKKLPFSVLCNAKASGTSWIFLSSGAWLINGWHDQFLKLATLIFYGI
jgi:hypothetical protein